MTVKLFGDFKYILYIKTHYKKYVSSIITFRKDGDVDSVDLIFIISTYNEYQIYNKSIKNKFVFLDKNILNLKDSLFLFSTWFLKTTSPLFNFASNSRYLFYKNNNHTIIRSSSLGYANFDNLKTLENIGISDIIDLRPNSTFIDKFLSIKCKIKYHNISFGNYKGIDYNHPLVYDDISISYMYLIEQHEVINNVFKTIINSERQVLIFCKYGRDRTGIVSILIGLLLNRPIKDILFDYLLSCIYLHNSYDKIPVYGDIKYPTYFLRGTKLLDLLNKFKDKYQSVDNYLNIIGLNLEDIIKLKLKVSDYDENI